MSFTAANAEISVDGGGEKKKKTGVARRDLGTFLKSLFHFYCGASRGTRKK